MALEMAPDLLEDRNLDLALQEMDRDQDKINFLLPLNKSGTVMFVLLLFITLICLPVPVLAGEKDIILEESGIHYPGGFDPNTVGVVQGQGLSGYPVGKRSGFISACFRKRNLYGPGLTGLVLERLPTESQ